MYELDPTEPYNNGFINDDFIVWMREAAFPNFKKLYGILDRGSSEQFRNGLPAGSYSIGINYSILASVSLPAFTRFKAFVLNLDPFAFPDFPPQPFHGKKLVVLTTLTWFGGQNHFLPIAYLVTSGLLLLIAVGLTALWWKFGKDGRNMKE